MRKNYTYMALSCAALLAFGSCVEENFEQITPAQVGDEIIFGVRAGFEDSAPETRTEYGGKESEYVYGGKTYERINWVAGDMVEIYSPDAANNSQSFHYTVTKTTSDPQPGTNKPTVGEHLKDYASLTRYGDAGIQWGSAETHHFYAMYPSSVMWTGNPDPEVTVKSGAFMDYDNGSPIVHGIIPITQNPTKPIYESTSGNWVIPADMKYAYMVARGEATKEDASVELTFVPIVTAVEMELKLDEAGSNESVDAVNIDYVQIIGRGIAGDFTADLSDWPANGYPKCTNSDNGTDVITIDVRGAEQQTKTIQAGGSLTFTVFLRPGANVEDLNVSFFDGTRFLGKDLKGANIPMNLKTRIVDIRLPKNVSKLPIYSDKWMDRISGDVEMKALSLPGTGNSFSYAYKGSNDYPRRYYATQSENMYIKTQWNLGVRAFEIVCNRPSFTDIDSKTATLGTQDVECNKTPVGIKVKDALDSLILKVRPEGTTKEEWTETAAVILTYQPHNEDIARNAQYFARALANFYDATLSTPGYEDIFKLYEPGTKLGDVRGSILLICRINQRHEGETSIEDSSNNNGNTGTNTSIAWAQDNFSAAINIIGNRNILLIDGCGTGKDKWGSRGYKVKSGENMLPVLDMDCKVDEVSTDAVTYSFVEQYMDNTSEWSNYISVPAHDVTGLTNPGNINFTYKTNQEGFNCWVQEWARVSNGSTNRPEYFRRYTNSGTVWYNSYNEKLANAAYTFHKSLNDATASMVYINWLGGYLVTTGVSGSYTRYWSESGTWGEWGGDGGDVQGLANKLNPNFMEVVENSGWENKTGPAGIVMIDYVGATSGAEKLPGTILMNNFRHDAAAGGGIIVIPPGGSGDGFDDEIEE